MSHMATRRLIAGLLVGQLAAAAGCQSMRSIIPWQQSPPPPQQQQQLLPGTSLTDAGPPPVLTKTQKLNVQLALAHAIERQNKPAEAISIYEEIVRKDGHNAEAYHRLAVLHDLLGKPEKAAEYYGLAIKYGPRNPETYCDLGYSQYLNRRWAEAEGNFRQALELNPDLARAHNNLGLLLARTGRQNDALQEFFRAGSNESDARYNAALALMLEQHWDDADRQCQTALKAGHASPETREKLDHLTAIIAQARPGQTAAALRETADARPASPAPSQQASFIPRSVPAAAFGPALADARPASPAPSQQTSVAPRAIPPVAPSPTFIGAVSFETPEPWQQARSLRQTKPSEPQHPTVSEVSSESTYPIEPASLILRIPPPDPEPSPPIASPSGT